MEKNTDDLKRKIAALFAKARSGGATSAESEAFEAHANKLMVQYAIAESELSDSDQTDAFGMVSFRLGPVGARSRRLVTLAARIARAHGAFCAYSVVNSNQLDYLVANGYPPEGSGTYVRLYGRITVIEACKLLTLRLATDALAQASELVADDPNSLDYDLRYDQATNTKRLRRDFLYGFADKVGERLEALNRQTDDETSGTLLPVLMSDSQRAAAMAGDMTPGRSFSLHTSSGVAAGRAAGDRANLADRSMPNGRKALSR